MTGVLFGCNPVYAAPVRGAGAPARLQAERMEIGGAAAGLTYPMAGGRHLVVGLEDWLSLEPGGNFMFTGQGWAMGWLGARFTRPTEHDLRCTRAAVGRKGAMAQSSRGLRRHGRSRESVARRARRREPRAWTQ